MKKILVCIGEGSVGKICIDILTKKKNYHEIKIIKSSKKIKNISIINQIKTIHKKYLIDVIIGFANIKELKENEDMFNILKNLKINLINVFHESAIFDENVNFGKGVKLFPGTIINRSCIIGNNVLINTGSIIDHECIIGEHSQIATGCTLSGNVKIGKLSFIGSGTTIIQGVKIGNNSIVGAGSVVIKNVPSNSTYAGVPAKKL